MKISQQERIIPRVCRKTDSSGRRGRILVVGNLVLDILVVLNVGVAELLRALKEGIEKVRCEWHLAKQQIGGYVGQVAPIVAELGYQAHISCVVSVPVLKQICDFLETSQFSTENVVVVPGPSPATVGLRFADGHVLFPRAGASSLATPPVPSNALEEFDAVLVNAGANPTRREVLGRLSKAHRSGNGRPVAGVIARGDWTREDLELFQGSGTWVFFNRGEALDASRRVSCNGNINDVEEAAIVLKSHLGLRPRVVVTLGERGALLLNSHRTPQWFSTSPVAGGRRVGAGDILSAFTTVGSGTGFSDEEALKLGVRAATNRVAGLPLPRI